MTKMDVIQAITVNFSDGRRAQNRKVAAANSKEPEVINTQRQLISSNGW
jgi:hypothetical protein